MPTSQKFQSPFPIHPSWREKDSESSNVLRSTSQMLAAQISLEYELEDDGFELPMVAMCGEVLNFETFEATIGTSESVANSLNLIGVTQLLKPQSQQGLAAFPLARNVLVNNVVIPSEYAACIQTDSVGTTTSVSSLQDEIQTRQDQKNFYLQTSLIVVVKNG